MRLDRSSAQQRAPSRRRVSAAAVAETDGIAFEKKTIRIVLHYYYYYY